MIKQSQKEVFDIFSWYHSPWIHYKCSWSFILLFYCFALPFWVFAYNFRTASYQHAIQIGLDTKLRNKNGFQFFWVFWLVWKSKIDIDIKWLILIAFSHHKNKNDLKIEWINIWPGSVLRSFQCQNHFEPIKKKQKLTLFFFSFLFFQ